MAGAMIRQDWLRRRDGARIVMVTEAGHADLRDWLGLDLAGLRGSS
jgi:hypothetical protein